MYDQQVSGLLTLDAYQRMGGLTGAIAERAEHLYTSGDAEFQRACRHVFTRLVTLGQGVPDTRRRVHRTEFGSGRRSTTSSRPSARRGCCRSITIVRTREPTVELAHEALIRDWPRLRQWLDDDREGLQMHRHLTASAVAWDARGREPGDLYRGGRLESVASWAETHAMTSSTRPRRRSSLRAPSNEMPSGSANTSASSGSARCLGDRRRRRGPCSLIAGATALVQRRNATRHVNRQNSKLPRP